MPLIKAVVNGVTGLLRRNGALAGAVKCCCGWVCAYVDAVPGGDKECYPKGQQPYPTSEDTEYKNETECRKYCDQEYVCAWKSFDPANGKECVKKGTEASPLLIISTYLTTDCDGMCVDEYYCAWKDDTPSKCYPDAPPVDFDSSGPYATAPDCEDNCKKKYNCRTPDYDCIEDPDGPYDSMKECEEYCKDTQYYCCQSPGGPKECHLGGCPVGMTQVGGPYADYDECDTNCKSLYYCCDDGTGERSCHPDQCPAGYTTVGVYTDETECNEKCPVYYVCVQKTPYPVDGYECVAWNNAIDPSLILNQYETPDCDGECPPDPVYFCCEDTTGDKDCYKYGCPPDRVEVGGPYSTPRECSIDCGVKYYCCEDSDGNKTCRDDECEYYGENTVGGPYDTKDLCEPECEKYYCCEDSNGERNCYKGTCPAGTEEKGGPYDDDVACKEAACAKVYWYCTAPDKCESSDSGPYDTEDACLDGAPEDCKEAYACQDNGDGTKTCVQDPNGEYDTDDCGGECEKPKKYSCVNGDCVLDPNGGYDDPNCDGACTKQKYACVGGVCVPDDNGPYDEDTCGGNCVKPECVVDADCGCDAPDTWFEGFGCCQDGQVPKPGTNQCWEDGRPGTETSLVATGECCNGQCVELCIGGCCTEYGLSYVSRKQCKEWGGTFHAPGEVFDTTCGCDCAGTGGQVSIPSACTKLSTWTRCDDVEGEYCSEESGQQESYAGYSPQFPQDDPAGLLDTIREKGAQIIGWVDIGSSFAQKPGDQEQTRCCLISGSRNKMKYRTFALNCRQKKWEEVANILAQYDSEGVGGTGGTGATCNGQTILASENPIPPAVNFVASAPTCIPPAAANPLP